MSYNENTDKIDWKDEFAWILISIVSGLILSFLFYYYQKFPSVNKLAITFFSCLAFYVLSILLRVQNQRGKVLTGKPGFDEKILKYVFPILGFAIGIALIYL
ncbi:MAG: hypothetical protein SWO11_19285 [Thermodesulfobacteriota bacterium]|nr:hypothetical protein [Thermodesulfobacteriota bacterium]